MFFHICCLILCFLALDNGHQFSYHIIHQSLTGKRNEVVGKRPLPSQTSIHGGIRNGWEDLQFGVTRWLGALRGKNKNHWKMLMGFCKTFAKTQINLWWKLPNSFTSHLRGLQRHLHRVGHPQLGYLKPSCGFQGGRTPSSRALQSTKIGSLFWLKLLRMIFLLS